MNKETSGVIDGLMRFLVGGGTIATILIAPGMAKVLDRPTRAYFKRLDKRQQQRELRRIVYYMKEKGLIAPTSYDYMHGMVVTKKGLMRLRENEFETLTISRPAEWDHKWRIVLFDIPESHRTGRKQLIIKLKQLGFKQLQRSVWVHPFSCRVEIEAITHYYKIGRFTSYIEATGIDNEKQLINSFKHLLK